MAQGSLHGAVVHLQLPGNGADSPLLDMVIAQDLSSEFRGHGHGVALSGVSNGQGDGCDSAGSQCEQTRHSRSHRNDTARVAVVSQLRWPLPRVAVEQAGLGVGNPDASLSRVLPGNGVAVGHGRGVHVGWLGSVVRLRARSRCVVWGRSLCSSGCHGRNGCTPELGYGSMRTGNAWQVAPLANGGRRGLGWTGPGVS